MDPSMTKENLLAPIDEDVSSEEIEAQVEVKAEEDQPLPYSDPQEVVEEVKESHFYPAHEEERKSNPAEDKKSDPAESEEY